MSRSRFAILLDGAFVIRKLEGRLSRFPTATDIEQLCTSLAQVNDLREGLRVYLDHMGHRITRALKAHCDVMFSNQAAA